MGERVEIPERIAIWGAISPSTLHERTLVHDEPATTTALSQLAFQRMHTPVRILARNDFSGSHHPSASPESLRAKSARRERDERF